MTELELEVQDGDITIWLPGSSYTVTYYKPKQVTSAARKAIVQRRSARSLSHLSSLQRLGGLPTHKAREFGWIV